MFVWCTVLFSLGILAFFDSVFNIYGDLFRQINSMFFMLISLGLLIRTATKKSEQKFEKYEHRILILENQVKKLEAENEAIAQEF
ncbi:MAG: hypothetical protein ABIJ45_03220 [Candidatus Zixiibacteriota bacterium]